MAFFDRSWYNRAVVEPVMGFCTPEQYDLFIEQVLLVESMLIKDGVQIFKFWFSIDAEEQKKRLEERIHNPLKQWKMSSVDVQAQSKWEEFTKFKLAMFDKTSTEESPWVVIKGNEREIARKEAMRFVLFHSEYEKKGQTGERLKPREDIISVYRRDPFHDRS